MFYFALMCVGTHTYITVLLPPPMIISLCKLAPWYKLRHLSDTLQLLNRLHWKITFLNLFSHFPCCCFVENTLPASWQVNYSSAQLLLTDMKEPKSLLISSRGSQTEFHLLPSQGQRGRRWMDTELWKMPDPEEKSNCSKIDFWS